MAHTIFFLLTCAILGHFTSEAATWHLRRIPWMFTTVNSFTWANCDGESLPGKIKSLSVSPDPISLPGDLTVSTVLTTTVPLVSPLKVVISAEKKLFGEWIKVPCVDNIGSCTYDNICDFLDLLVPPGQECPEPLHSYGLPCHCPFRSGSYSLPETTFTIPNVSLPSWLANGNYRVTVILEAGEKEMGCAKFTFSLAASFSWWL
ncbi:ganglioside GM2 activator [Bombina bombina]|uniref:ganglioside GM2 activator n=1 Tax=Bombina bombina TaxID=8345 RepID=UPI00235A8DC9|nr:ganglioside GM2 activator [Bombina bombina]XP_053574660.1 ganglioside GM2 activator [Bombina bombina]